MDSKAELSRRFLSSRYQRQLSKSISDQSDTLTSDDELNLVKLLNTIASSDLSVIYCAPGEQRILRIQAICTAIQVLLSPVVLAMDTTEEWIQYENNVWQQFLLTTIPILTESLINATVDRCCRLLTEAVYTTVTKFVATRRGQSNFRLAELRNLLVLGPILATSAPQKLTNPLIGDGLGERCLFLNSMQLKACQSQTTESILLRENEHNSDVECVPLRSVLAEEKPWETSMAPISGGHGSYSGYVDNTPVRFWPDEWEMYLGESRAVGQRVLLWRPFGTKGSLGEQSLTDWRFSDWRMIIDNIGEDVNRALNSSSSPVDNEKHTDDSPNSVAGVWRLAVIAEYDKMTNAYTAILTNDAFTWKPFDGSEKTLHHNDDEVVIDLTQETVLWIDFMPSTPLSFQLAKHSPPGVRLQYDKQHDIGCYVRVYWSRYGRYYYGVITNLLLRPVTGGSAKDEKATEGIWRHQILYEDNNEALHDFSIKSYELLTPPKSLMVKLSTMSLTDRIRQVHNWHTQQLNDNTLEDSSNDQRPNITIVEADRKSTDRRNCMSLGTFFSSSQLVTSGGSYGVEILLTRTHFHRIATMSVPQVVALETFTEQYGFDILVTILLRLAGKSIGDDNSGAKSNSSNEDEYPFTPRSKDKENINWRSITLAFYFLCSCVDFCDPTIIRCVFWDLAEVLRGLVASPTEVITEILVEDARAMLVLWNQISGFILNQFIGSSNSESIRQKQSRSGATLTEGIALSTEALSVIVNVEVLRLELAARLLADGATISTRAVALKVLVGAVHTLSPSLRHILLNRYEALELPVPPFLAKGSNDNFDSDNITQKTGKQQNTYISPFSSPTLDFLCRDNGIEAGKTSSSAAPIYTWFATSHIIAALYRSGAAHEAIVGTGIPLVAHLAHENALSSADVAAVWLATITSHETIRRVAIETLALIAPLMNSIALATFWGLLAKTHPSTWDVGTVALMSEITALELKLPSLSEVNEAAYGSSVGNGNGSGEHIHGCTNPKQCSQMCEVHTSEVNCRAIEALRAAADGLEQIYNFVHPVSSPKFFPLRAGALEKSTEDNSSVVSRLPLRGGRLQCIDFLWSGIVKGEIKDGYLAASTVAALVAAIVTFYPDDRRAVMVQCITAFRLGNEAVSGSLGVLRGLLESFPLNSIKALGAAFDRKKRSRGNSFIKILRERLGDTNENSNTVETLQSIAKLLLSSNFDTELVRDMVKYCAWDRPEKNTRAAKMKGREGRTVNDWAMGLRLRLDVLAFITAAADRQLSESTIMPIWRSVTHPPPVTISVSQNCVPPSELYSDGNDNPDASWASIARERWLSGIDELCAWLETVIAVDSRPTVPVLETMTAMMDADTMPATSSNIALDAMKVRDDDASFLAASKELLHFDEDDMETSVNNDLLCHGSEEEKWRLAFSVKAWIKYGTIGNDIIQEKTAPSYPISQLDKLDFCIIPGGSGGRLPLGNLTSTLVAESTVTRIVEDCLLGWAVRPDRYKLLCRVSAARLSLRMIIHLAIGPLELSGGTLSSSVTDEGVLSTGALRVSTANIANWKRRIICDPLNVPLDALRPRDCDGRWVAVTPNSIASGGAAVCWRLAVDSDDEDIAVVAIRLIAEWEVRSIGKYRDAEIAVMISRITELIAATCNSTIAFEKAAKEITTSCDKDKQRNESVSQKDVVPPDAVASTPALPDTAGVVDWFECRAESYCDLKGHLTCLSATPVFRHNETADCVHKCVQSESFLERRVRRLLRVLRRVVVRLHIPAIISMRISIVTPRRNGSLDVLATIEARSGDSIDDLRKRVAAICRLNPEDIELLYANDRKGDTLKGFDSKKGYLTRQEMQKAIAESMIGGDIGDSLLLGDTRLSQRDVVLVRRKRKVIRLAPLSGEAKEETETESGIRAFTVDSIHNRFLLPFSWLGFHLDPLQPAVNDELDGKLLLLPTQPSSSTISRLLFATRGLPSIKDHQSPSTSFGTVIFRTAPVLTETLLKWVDQNEMLHRLSGHTTTAGYNSQLDTICWDTIQALPFCTSIARSIDDLMNRVDAYQHSKNSGDVPFYNTDNNEIGYEKVFTLRKPALLRYQLQLLDTAIAAITDNRKHERLPQTKPSLVAAIRGLTPAILAARFGTPTLLVPGVHSLASIKSLSSEETQTEGDEEMTLWLLKLCDRLIDSGLVNHLIHLLKQIIYVLNHALTTAKRPPQTPEQSLNTQEETAYTDCEFDPNDLPRLFLGRLEWVAQVAASILRVLILLLRGDPIAAHWAFLPLAGKRMSSAAITSGTANERQKDIRIQSVSNNVMAIYIELGMLEILGSLTTACIAAFQEKLISGGTWKTIVEHSTVMMMMILIADDGPFEVAAEFSTNPELVSKEPKIRLRPSEVAYGLTTLHRMFVAVFKRPMDPPITTENCGLIHEGKTRECLHQAVSTYIVTSSEADGSAEATAAGLARAIFARLCVLVARTNDSTVSGISNDEYSFESEMEDKSPRYYSELDIYIGPYGIAKRQRIFDAIAYMCQMLPPQSTYATISVASSLSAALERLRLSPAATIRDARRIAGVSKEAEKVAAAKMTDLSFARVSEAVFPIWKKLGPYKISLAKELPSLQSMSEEEEVAWYADCVPVGYESGDGWLVLANSKTGSLDIEAATALRKRVSNCIAALQRLKPREDFRGSDGDPHVVSILRHLLVIVSSPMTRRVINDPRCLNCIFASIQYHPDNHLSNIKFQQRRTANSNFGPSILSDISDSISQSDSSTTQTSRSESDSNDDLQSFSFKNAKFLQFDETKNESSYRPSFLYSGKDWENLAETPSVTCYDCGGKGSGLTSALVTALYSDGLFPYIHSNNISFSPWKSRARCRSSRTLAFAVICALISPTNICTTTHTEVATGRSSTTTTTNDPQAEYWSDFYLPIHSKNNAKDISKKGLCATNEKVNVKVENGIRTVETIIFGDSPPSLTHLILSIAAVRSAHWYAADSGVCRRVPWDYRPSNAVRHPGESAGLRNQGATCYINALIQQLAHTPEFRRSLLSLETRPPKKDTESPIQAPPTTSVLFELQKVIAALAVGPWRAVDTAALCAELKDFGGEPLVTSEQKDLCEFADLLFDQISKTPTYTWNKLDTTGSGVIETKGAAEVIEKVMTGALAYHTRSIETEYVSRKQEPFVMLSVPVRGHASLESSIAATVAPERLTGENRIQDDTGLKNTSGESIAEIGSEMIRKSNIEPLFPRRTARHVEAVRVCTLAKLPSVLAIHLKRFEFDASTQQRRKVTDRLAYPPVIDVAPYTEEYMFSKGSLGPHPMLPAGTIELPPCGLPATFSSAETGINKEVTKYRLVGVVAHGGSIDGGHYWSYVRHRRSCRWWEMNDSSALPVLSATLPSATFGHTMMDSLYPSDEVQAPVTRPTKRTHNTISERKFSGKLDYLELEDEIAERSAYLLLYERDDITLITDDDDSNTDYKEASSLNFNTTPRIFEEEDKDMASMAPSIREALDNSVYAIAQDVFVFDDNNLSLQISVARGLIYQLRQAKKTSDADVHTLFEQNSNNTTDTMVDCIRHAVNNYRNPYVNSSQGSNASSPQDSTELASENYQESKSLSTVNSIYGSNSVGPSHVVLSLSIWLTTAIAYITSGIDAFARVWSHSAHHEDAILFINCLTQIVFATETTSSILPIQLLNHLSTWPISSDTSHTATIHWCPANSYVARQDINGSPIMLRRLFSTVANSLHTMLYECPHDKHVFAFGLLLWNCIATAANDMTSTLTLTTSAFNALRKAAASFEGSVAYYDCLSSSGTQISRARRNDLYYPAKGDQEETSDDRIPAEWACAFAQHAVMSTDGHDVSVMTSIFAQILSIIDISREERRFSYGTSVVLSILASVTRYTENTTVPSDSKHVGYMWENDNNECIDDVVKMTAPAQSVLCAILHKLGAPRRVAGLLVILRSKANQVNFARDSRRCVRVILSSLAAGTIDCPNNRYFGSSQLRKINLETSFLNGHLQMRKVETDPEMIISGGVVETMSSGYFLPSSDDLLLISQSSLLTFLFNTDTVSTFELVAVLAPLFTAKKLIDITDRLIIRLIDIVVSSPSPSPLLIRPLVTSLADLYTSLDPDQISNSETYQQLETLILKTRSLLNRRGPPIAAVAELAYGIQMLLHRIGTNSSIGYSLVVRLKHIWEPLDAVGIASASRKR